MLRIRIYTLFLFNMRQLHLLLIRLYMIKCKTSRNVKMQSKAKKITHSIVYMIHLEICH